MLSPKIEIINHFDNLISRVDIDIEESLGKYKQDQVFGELECFQVENRNYRGDSIFQLEFDSYESTHETKVQQWSQSTKVTEYLNMIRMRTIEELKIEQEKRVKNSKIDTAELLNHNNTEHLKSRLFNDNFYFYVNFTSKSNPWLFKLYIFVTNFYMSPTDISILENLINNSENDHIIVDSKLDEKMVLIGLILNYFCDNLKTQQIPNHVIRVVKQDLLKVKRIDFKYRVSGINLTATSIDLSNVESLSVVNDKNKFGEINIEGHKSSLKTLELRLDSVERVSFKYLYELELLELFISTPPQNIQTDIFDHLPNLEKISLDSSLLHFEYFVIQKAVHIIKAKNENKQQFDTINAVFVDLCTDNGKKIEELHVNLSDTEKIFSLLDYFLKVKTVTLYNPS